MLFNDVCLRETTVLSIGGGFPYPYGGGFPYPLLWKKNVALCRVA